MIGRDLEIGIIDRRFHRRVVVEHQSRAGMPEKAPLACAGFDDAAIGSEIAPEDSERSFGKDRIGNGSNDIVPAHFRMTDAPHEVRCAIGVRFAKMDRRACVGRGSRGQRAPYHGESAPEIKAAASSHWLAAENRTLQIVSPYSRNVHG